MFWATSCRALTWQRSFVSGLVEPSFEFTLMRGVSGTTVERYWTVACGLGWELRQCATAARRGAVSDHASSQRSAMLILSQTPVLPPKEPGQDAIILPSSSPAHTRGQVDLPTIRAGPAFLHLLLLLGDIRAVARRPGAQEAQLAVPQAVPHLVQAGTQPPGHHGGLRAGGVLLL